jgi:putative tryptophan/tyrosine transport system substrate-binding protein
MIRRRTFITLLGGSAVAWPLAARAQQPERMRRIGVLAPAAANDPVWQARVGAFQQALALLGWIIGRNVQIDTRWATTDAAAIRSEAEELAALAPDVILAAGHSSAAPLLQATRTVPIVFVMVQDAVAAGFVDSLARPGGNLLGSRPGNSAWARSGWNCSSSLRRALREWQFCEMPAKALRLASLWLSRPWRRRSGSR